MADKQTVGLIYSDPADVTVLKTLQQIVDEHPELKAQLNQLLIKELKSVLHEIHYNDSDELTELKAYSTYQAVKKRIKDLENQLGEKSIKKNGDTI